MLMNVRTRGKPDRPAVVLLHALGCHSGWWNWTAPLLAERHFVIAPDLRGHGDSPPGETYAYSAYAADVEELLAKLGLESYFLAGHSMGGYIALEMAARNLRPPRALVVIDMKTGATEQELADLAAAAARPARVYPSLDEAVARYRVAPPAQCIPAERLAAVAAECYRRTEPDGQWMEKMDRRALAIGPLDPFGLAAGAGCPILFVRGEHSLIMPAEPAAELAGSAGARLVTLPGLFHHLPLEAPEALASLIADFVATQQPSP